MSSTPTRIPIQNPASLLTHEERRALDTVRQMAQGELQSGLYKALNYKQPAPSVEYRLSGDARREAQVYLETWQHDRRRNPVILAWVEICKTALAAQPPAPAEDPDDASPLPWDEKDILRLVREKHQYCIGASEMVCSARSLLDLADRVLDGKQPPTPAAHPELTDEERAALKELEYRIAGEMPSARLTPGRKYVLASAFRKVLG